MGSPIYTGGAGYPFVLATEAGGGGSRQRRVGEGHLGAVLDSVNTLFESFLNFLRKPQNSAIFSPMPSPRYVGVRLK